MADDLLNSLIPLESISGLLSGVFTKIIAASLIFLLGFIFGKFAGKVIQKLLNEVELNKFIRKSAGLRVPMEEIAGTTVATIVYFFALVSSLTVLGLINILFHVLAILILVGILISFFLSVRDFFPNLAAGIYLHQKYRLKKGSEIEVDAVKGKVVSYELIHTAIETGDGDLLYLPNAMILRQGLRIVK